MHRGQKADAATVQRDDCSAMSLQECGLSAASRIRFLMIGRMLPSAGLSNRVPSAASMRCPARRTISDANRSASGSTPLQIKAR